METKLLVVDDDVNICELLRLFLEKEDYEIMTSHHAASHRGITPRHTPSSTESS